MQIGLEGRPFASIDKRSHKAGWSRNSQDDSPEFVLLRAYRGGESSYCLGIVMLLLWWSMQSQDDVDGEALLTEQ